MSERPRQSDPEVTQSKRRLSTQFKMIKLKQQRADILLDRMIEQLNGHDTDPPPNGEAKYATAQRAPDSGR
jgi:hypothetical protein